MSGLRYVDLSHTLSGDTPALPGHPRTVLTQRKRLDEDRYNAFYLETELHTGTHVDMPMHMLDDARTAAGFPLDSFAGPGALLDARGEMVIDWRPAFDAMDMAGRIVLLHTGWDARYGDAAYFSGYPVVTDAFAQRLLEKRPKMLGVDLPAPDAPPHRVHKLLLRADILILENLTNLGALVGVASFEVMAFPLKLAAEASVVRAVAAYAG